MTFIIFIAIIAYMIDKIKQFFEFASKNGLYFPGAYDNDKQGPSASLLFAHVANIVAIWGLITLINKDALQGVLAAISYSVLMIVFYLMRRISSFKADLDDKSIELDSGEEKNDK